MPPLNSGNNYFAGKYHVKFGHFVNFGGKYYVKLGHFVHFSGKYVKCRHFKFLDKCHKIPSFCKIFMYTFSGKNVLPPTPKLTELLRL